MTDARVAIVVLRVPASQAVRLQGMLAGEDGLATMRCRDPERQEQELWTTPARLQELRDWLGSLPAGLGLECVREEMFGEQICRDG